MLVVHTLILSISSFRTETLTSAECNNEPIIRLAFIQRIFKLTDYVAQCSYCQAPPNPHSSSEVCTNCYQVFYCDELVNDLSPWSIRVFWSLLIEFAASYTRQTIRTTVDFDQRRTMRPSAFRSLSRCRNRSWPMKMSSNRSVSMPSEWCLSRARIDAEMFRWMLE